MSLAGTIEELPLPDILSILFMAEKTGRLRLSATSSEGIIVLRRGRIIYASSNSAREAFGSILICQNLVDEATLRTALLRQHRSREERRLGTILVEMGALTPGDVERVLTLQVERVLLELFSWREGFFKFEPLEITDRGEVEVDGREFLVDPGLNTHKIALDLSRRLDERQEDAAQPASVSTPRRSTAAGRRAAEAALPGSPPGPLTLGELLSERQEVSLTAETTLELLRQARKALARGVLLLVDRHSLNGVGQFGIHDGETPGDERVRCLRLPLDKPSILAEVASKQKAYHGPLSRLAIHQALIASLGGSWPNEVVVLPLSIHDRTVAVLYGDNNPLRTPITDLSPLARLLAEIGERLEVPRPLTRAASG